MPRDIESGLELIKPIVIGTTAPIVIQSPVDNGQPGGTAKTASLEAKLNVRMPDGEIVQAIALAGNPDPRIHRPIRVIIPGIDGMKTLHVNVDSSRALAAKAITPEGSIIDLTARDLLRLP